MGGDIVRAVMVSAGILGSVMGTIPFTYLMVWNTKYDGTRCIHHYTMLSFSATLGRVY